MANPKSTLTVAIGTAFAASLAMSPAARAAGNPFAMQSLNSGYMVADMGKGMEGKCGGMKAGDGKKSDESKCGVLTKDGKMTKADFMKTQEEIFDKMDVNKDGVVTEDEMKAAKDCKSGAKKSADGKCGGMTK